MSQFYGREVGLECSPFDEFEGFSANSCEITKVVFFLITFSTFGIFSKYFRQFLLTK